jgi:hypothetical protein
MDHISGDEGLWLRRFRPAGSTGNRLICFPHAGGSAAFFLPVARALAPAVNVLAVQYPGRQDRRAEPCIDNIPALADHVSRVLAGLLDRPLALFGHSLVDRFRESIAMMRESIIETDPSAADRLAYLQLVQFIRELARCVIAASVAVKYSPSGRSRLRAAIWMASVMSGVL